MIIVEKDLTFVFQGKYNDETLSCIKKTKQNYPCSRYILSCWKEDKDTITNDVLLLVDELILTEDPGALKIDNFKVDNLGRQIASSFEGIKAVKTEYAIKIRTDCYLSNNALHYLCVEVSEGDIIAIDFTTLDPRKKKLYFHICDWFFFGKQSLLLDLFDIPIPDAEYYKFYSNNKNVEFGLCSQLRAESYIGYNYARNKKFTRINYNSIEDYSQELEDTTIDFFEKKFFIVPALILGLRSTKHKFFQFSNTAGKYYSVNSLSKKSNLYFKFFLVYLCESFIVNFVKKIRDFLKKVCA